MRSTVSRMLAVLTLLFVALVPLALAQVDTGMDNDGTTGMLPLAPPAIDPANPLPLAPMIGLLSTGLVWLITWVAKKVSPTLDAGKVAPWIGTALGAVIALVTYLTGAFPSATWMQTVLLIATSLSGGLAGGVGAGIFDRRVVKAVLQGEPSVETKVAVIETTPAIRKEPSV